MIIALLAKLLLYMYLSDGDAQTVPVFCLTSIHNAIYIVNRIVRAVILVSVVQVPDLEIKPKNCV